MTDFFKNNPTALRHCILFEVLQGASAEKTYSNICSVMGEEVIDYNNFMLSFDQFSTGKSNKKKKEIPCAPILRNDKYALRVCILYESLKYRNDNLNGPVFDIFVHFCKVIGVEETLKFSEFEFRFYRFLNGEFDLNYERDMDKKVYELSNMPIDVMKNIMDYLDMFDRANLVRASRSLRTFIEDHTLFLHTLKLKISHYTAIVSFGKTADLQYICSYNGCTKISKNREKFIRGVLYWKQAIRDIRQILMNPNLHLDTLEIELNVNKRRVFNDLEDALKFDHHLNVKNLILEEYSSDLITRILPSLKPGYLTTINIDRIDPDSDSIRKVFEMEQWKQAKRFHMDGGRFIWQLHHLYHFKKFTVILKQLAVEDIRQMKKILFASPNFKKCSILGYDDTSANAIKEEFGDYLLHKENTSELKKTYHYPIPNSTEYFEIRVEGHRFKVARKKK